MKFQLLVFTFLVSFGQIFAQVGVGTNTPNASAQLDVSSNNKGLLAPRMTSAQRTGIANPAKGLLVYDTSVNGLYHYNGAAWASVGGGGGFSLPFSQTVNLGISAFQVINEGPGASIEGSSTNELGVGTLAKVTGDYGYGLYALSNKPGANSIYAFADSGTVFHGENKYVGNTNTLMSLLNRGIAKTATFQLANNSSADANVQIAGNNLGEQLLVFQTNAANTKPAISVSNSGTGAGVNSVANNGTGVTATSTSGMGLIGTSTSNIGVSGVSTNSYGVRGSTTSTNEVAGVFGLNTGLNGAGVRGNSNSAASIGVYGFSTNGTGVKGYSENNIGVYGLTTSGTALNGVSSSGYSLDVSGKVKIAGGNTNPSPGAVLTSVDASGNAVWSSPTQVSFKAYGMNSNQNVFTTNGYYRIHYGGEVFDMGNNFTLLVGAAAPTAASSTFTAPVSGIYHFDLGCLLDVAGDDEEFDQAGIQLMRQRSGVADAILAEQAGMKAGQEQGIFSLADFASFALSTDERLLAGDKVYVRVLQNSGVNASIIYGLTNWFSGHLVFKE